MEHGKLTIHTENILPIIKKWLYSDKEIFLRELIANACDALQKFKILQETQGKSTSGETLTIHVDIDKDKKTLTVADTGVGMTKDEVVKYIAQVAFSGAEEFLGQYKNTATSEAIIGHFGLGFYSAYMVSSLVDIDTLSYVEGSAPAHWSCNGSIDYTLETGSRAERGTTITLHIDQESEEYLEPSRLREILKRYCSFLPFPIYLGGEQINKEEPLWIQPVASLSEKDYLGFYHTLYPYEPDPVFWVHINVDYPFNLKGILYFPKLERRFEWDKSLVKLFCNRVFVSDNCKDLLPDFLMILRGAIDSPDIPLNVSRSYLQMDRTVKQLSQHIAKKIADRLLTFFTMEKEKFIETWHDIETIVKLGILQDEKFAEKATECLIWKTLDGNWVTIKEYQTAQPENAKNNIFYTVDDQLSPALIDLYKKQNMVVLIANPHIDAAVMNSLEMKHAPLKFQRIDGTLGDHLIDASREKGLLNASGKSESAQIAAFFKHALSNVSIEVEAKSLANDALPALIVVDEQQRRVRDYFLASGQKVPTGPSHKKTFVVNTNNKLINAIYHLQEKNPALAKEMGSHLYDLSLLGQREFEPGSIASFIERSTRVLEELLRP